VSFPSVFFLHDIQSRFSETSGLPQREQRGTSSTENCRAQSEHSPLYASAADSSVEEHNAQCAGKNISLSSEAVISDLYFIILCFII
jgi:hypothetical protein